MTSLQKTAPFGTLWSAVLLYLGLVWQGIIKLIRFWKIRKSGNFRLTLSQDHWNMLSEEIGKDDQSKIQHLDLFNIHVLDENVKQFSKIISQVKWSLYVLKLNQFSRISFITQQVESVSLSSLGRCGEFNTYSQYPDMNSDVWLSIKVGLI